MILNYAVTGLVALITGYLLGSLPSAYIVTRLVTGKDIRTLGSGNVGAANTARQAGFVPGLIVAIADVGKGVASVATIYWTFGLQDLNQPWVLLAAAGAVAGHNWMVWLKFSGGRGMGTNIGALGILMYLYGYWPGILIFLGIAAILYFFTRNISLSTGVAMISAPIIGWLVIKSGWFVAWSFASGLVMGLKFLPTAREAWSKSKDKRNFFIDRSGNFP